MKNILITNVFGAANKGDQALFIALCDAIKVANPGIQLKISAIASFPSINKVQFPEVNFYGYPWRPSRNRSKIRYFRSFIKSFLLVLDIFQAKISGRPISNFLNLYNNADIVIACPGGYLEDSNLSYYTHLLQLIFAICLGKRLLLAPQSVGPLRDPLAKSILRFILLHSEAVFLRERYSYDFCIHILETSKSTSTSTSTSTNIFLSSDLVLLDFQLFLDKKAPLSSTRVNKNTPRSIGLTVVGWNFYGNKTKLQTYITELRNTIRILIEKGNYVYILPQTVSDFEKSIVNEITFNLDVNVLPQPPDLRSYIDYYDLIDVIIGCRLHSCLLGIAKGVPAISISYLPKCSYIMEDLGLNQYVLPIDSFKSSSILSILNNSSLYDDYLKTFNSTLPNLSFKYFSSFIKCLKA